MVDVKNLSVVYSRDGVQTKAVNGFSFSVPQGSFTGIVGESGSGKTTVIMAVLGLLPDSAKVSGHIYMDGVEITGMAEEELRRLRSKKMAFVPQGALNSFTPVLTIGHHISEVLELHSGIKGGAASDRIAALLGEVGLNRDISGRYPHELSGGQKQRAAIALALACSPSLLLADEPTTALDVMIQSEILDLLNELRARKKLTILLITHDLPLAASACDRLIVMQDGLLVEEGTPSEIIWSPTHSHTKDLVRAML